ncbi:conserved hypothetical protein, partial [methanotrophic bacterial endosymbiont of Bathymodiolus sp.]
VKETPPRAWGRHHGEWDSKTVEGNTPTGVGKTLIDRINMNLIEKHPHGRGEDSQANEIHEKEMETPPRAWGRRFFPSIVIPVL